MKKRKGEKEKELTKGGTHTQRERGSISQISILFCLEPSTSVCCKYLCGLSLSVCMCAMFGGLLVSFKYFIYFSSFQEVSFTELEENDAKLLRLLEIRI